MYNVIPYTALDNDLYKFTMQQAVLHNYPDAIVKYKFKLRNPEVTRIGDADPRRDGIIDDEFLQKLRRQLLIFCHTTRFTSDELSYLKSIRFMKPDYIDFLEDFTFKERYVDIKYNKGKADITIEGPWVQTILFEVPLLYMISEIYSGARTTWDTVSFINAKIMQAKLLYSNIKFADFGTRRRFSKTHHYLLIEQLSKLKNFIGTSNVQFAKEFNLRPIGTMAHEWLQAHQALARVRDSQKVALETWAREYRGDLGIALSDVVGFDAFLRDFDPYFAKLFDGCRHDSGDPEKWIEKLIAHYESMGIDPRTKYAVFSDGLTFEKADRIHRKYFTKMHISFGIGTFLTNDCGIKPLQIVIKMIECNGKPVAKISDSKGKGMCEDESYLKYLKDIFDIREEK